MKAVKKYLKNRKNAIDLLLKKNSRSFTPDTFHQLRVEIKKLDALFELIDFCAGKFKKNKTSKPFRRIFNQAGKVRELQVEEDILKNYFIDRSLQDYRNSIRRIKLKERKIFFSILNEDLKEELKKSYRKTLHFTEEINKKKAGYFLKQEEKKIKKLLIQGNLSNARIHELRKLLKRHFYVRKSLQLADRPKFFNKNAAFLTLSGEWHDYQKTIEHLNKVLNSRSEIGPDDAVQIKKIKKKISSDSNRLLNKIRTAIAAFENKSLSPSALHTPASIPQAP